MYTYSENLIRQARAGLSAPWDERHSGVIVRDHPDGCFQREWWYVGSVRATRSFTTASAFWTWHVLMCNDVDCCASAFIREDRFIDALLPLLHVHGRSQ